MEKRLIRFQVYKIKWVPTDSFVYEISQEIEACSASTAQHNKRAIDTIASKSRENYLIDFMCLRFVRLCLSLPLSPCRMIRPNQRWKQLRIMWSKRAARLTAEAGDVRCVCVCEICRTIAARCLSHVAHHHFCSAGSSEHRHTHALTRPIVCFWFAIIIIVNGDKVIAMCVRRSSCCPRVFFCLCVRLCLLFRVQAPNK